MTEEIPKEDWFESCCICEKQIAVTRTSVIITKENKKWVFCSNMCAEISQFDDEEKFDGLWRIMEEIRQSRNVAIKNWREVIQENARLQKALEEKERKI